MLVATGEVAPVPAIHIWDYLRTLTVTVIKGHHHSSIEMLSFFKDDQFLITAGGYCSHPLFVYNIRDGSLVMSAKTDSPVVTILQTPEAHPPQDGKTLSTSL